MRGKKFTEGLVKAACICILCLCGVISMPKTIFAANDNDAFRQQKAADLLEKGMFRVSGNVQLKADDKANGVFVQGMATDISSAVFTLGDTFAFGQDRADYFMVDALAERKKNITLAFYLDNEKQPFATTVLAKQKKKELWSSVKNRCVSLDTKNITGTHRLSFRVLTEETGSVSLVFRSFTFMKNDIPMVEFDLDESEGLISAMNSDTEHATECYGNMTLKVPEEYRSEYTGKACATQTYTLDYIRGRGNSTWNSPKKPYKLKLETKQDLLGMGANKHWVLLANYYDVTMLRNKITYWIGNQLNMEFTPKCEFVNVVMNGEYLGSYYLCEQVRVGKSRVDIDDLEKDEASKNATDEKTISGGYLLSLFPYADDGKQSFTTDRQNTFLIESPAFEDYYNDTQVNYIKNYVQNTEDAIYGKDFKDKAGISYEKYMDIDSAIDYYWIQEVSMNGDAFSSGSTYLYKKRNGKLYWGPLWDFDFVAWGATDYSENYCSGYIQNDRIWYKQLFYDPVFYNKAVERWKVVREKILQACEDGGQIDKYSKKQYESQKHNYEIWKNFSNMFSMEDGNFSSHTVTYDDEIIRLKQWMRERVEWIDNNLENLKSSYKTVTFIVDDKEIAKIQVQQDTVITDIPAEPKKDGYLFDGWYTVVKYGDEEFETPFSVDSEITEDITVNAKWKKVGKVQPIKTLAFEREDIYIEKLETAQLKISVIPFEADSAGIVWRSENSDIADIEDNGMVITKQKTGTTVITATAPNGVSASCKVHVLDYSEINTVRSFRLKTKELNIRPGEYAHVETVLLPVPAADYFVTTYVSSDENIVKVDQNGYICGIKEGTALIAVSYPNMGIHFCKVTVKGSTVEPPVKNGTVFTVNGIKYRVLSTGADKKAACIGIKNKKAGSVTVPDTVKYRGKIYKITEIGKKALANCKRLTKAEIGKNIIKIGDEAFANCHKLKKLTILSNKLQKAGKNVLKRTSAQIKLSAPKGKKAKYKKLLNIKK